MPATVIPEPVVSTTMTGLTGDSTFSVVSSSRHDSDSEAEFGSYRYGVRGRDRSRMGLPFVTSTRGTTFASSSYDDGDGDGDKDAHSDDDHDDGFDDLDDHDHDDDDEDDDEDEGEDGEVRGTVSRRRRSRTRTRSRTRPASRGRRNGRRYDDGAYGGGWNRHDLDGDGGGGVIDGDDEHDNEHEMLTQLQTQSTWASTTVASYAAAAPDRSGAGGNIGSSRNRNRSRSRSRSRSRRPYRGSSLERGIGGDRVDDRVGHDDGDRDHHHERPSSSSGGADARGLTTAASGEGPSLRTARTDLTEVTVRSDPMSTGRSSSPWGGRRAAEGGSGGGAGGGMRRPLVVGGVAPAVVGGGGAAAAAAAAAAVGGAGLGAALIPPTPTAAAPPPSLGRPPTPSRRTLTPLRRGRSAGVSVTTRGENDAIGNDGGGGGVGISQKNSRDALYRIRNLADGIDDDDDEEERTYDARTYDDVGVDTVKGQFAPKPPALTWRLDPDESLSDWTLTVVATTEQHDDDVGGGAGGRRHEDDVFGNDAGGEMDDGERTGGGKSRGSVRNRSRDARAAAKSKSFVSSSSSLGSRTSLPGKSYFVHRTQLAVGPRRSEYFSSLFKSRRRAEEAGEKPTNRTRIELRPSAADAFPAMLDFIYSPVGTPPDVTTESAVALRHLASCFGVRELFNSVTAFVKRDLRAETAPTYLIESDTYKHEKLAAASVKTCAEHFESIKLSRIVVLPPPLFERVVRSPHLRCESEVLSSRVASYCRCRPGGVGLETLNTMTDADVMPKVAPEEALFYIHLLSILGVDLPDRRPKNGEGDDRAGGSLSVTEPGGKPTLYERCVLSSPHVVRSALDLGGDDALVAGRTETGARRNRKNAGREYATLDSSIKVDLLETTLHSHRSLEADVARRGKAEEDALREANRSVRIELDEARREVARLRDDMREMRRRHESKVASYESRLASAERSVVDAEAELSKFVRVPNSWRAPPQTESHTYAEPRVRRLDRYDAEDVSLMADPSGEGYGTDPPSALPRLPRRRKPGKGGGDAIGGGGVGDDEAEGWVYREEIWYADGGREPQMRLWPMYFYRGEEK